MSDSEANRILLTTKITSMLAHAAKQGVMALTEKANEIPNNPEFNHIFSRAEISALIQVVIEKEEQKTRTEQSLKTQEETVI